LLCVQLKTDDDGQRNRPKHVEFYSKNKFEKLVHLVGFIIRIYHDAPSPERQISVENFPLNKCIIVNTHTRLQQNNCAFEIWYDFTDSCLYYMEIFVAK